MIDGVLVMKTIKDHIRELNEQIEELTDCFYQQKIEDGYEKLEKLYPYLISIIDELNELENKNEFNVNISNILNKLKDTMLALENKDIILLSDIMKYELLSEFNYISKKII